MVRILLQENSNIIDFMNWMPLFECIQTKLFIHDL